MITRAALLLAALLLIAGCKETPTEVIAPMGDYDFSHWTVILEKSRTLTTVTRYGWLCGNIWNRTDKSATVKIRARFFDRWDRYFQDKEPIMELRGEIGLLAGTADGGYCIIIPFDYLPAKNQAYAISGWASELKGLAQYLVVVPPFELHAHEQTYFYRLNFDIRSQTETRRFVKEGICE